jgi:quinoprotein glucose dehydrogenase
MLRFACFVRELAGTVIIAAVGTNAQKYTTGWTDYLGGPDSSHFSPLKQITPANISKLEVVWNLPAGDGNYTFSPLVADNIAYVAADQGELVALDATTGKELWSHPFTGAGGRAGSVGSAA